MIHTSIATVTIFLFPPFSYSEIKKHDEASGSGEYEESGSATRLYYADEVSGSGSSDHAEDDDDDYGMRLP